jgi:hypothetical protein
VVSLGDGPPARGRHAGHRHLVLNLLIVYSSLFATSAARESAPSPPGAGRRRPGSMARGARADRSGSMDVRRSRADSAAIAAIRARPGP